MPMTVTVQNMITDAMSLIGAIAIEETPTTSELTLGLRVFNTMLDKYSSINTLIRSTTQDQLAVVEGTASYTIGPSGATWTTAKPLRIDHAFIRDSDNNDESLQLLTEELYDNIEDKGAEGKPIALMYDPGESQQATGKGTIYLYYTPDDSYTLFLSSYKYLTEFNAVSDTVTFEPMYYEPLIYNLAVRLFRHYHGAAVQLPGDLAALAKAGTNVLENINAVQKVAQLEIPTAAFKGYDIFTDN